jgi:ABC-type sulfate transport system permease component
MAAEQRHFNVKGDIIRMQSIPVGILLIGTIIILLIADQAGYSLGHAAMQRAVNEKESSVSTRASAILALVAFILAFTFGIVSNRYDSRKELVRNEATAIRTA